MSDDRTPEQVAAAAALCTAIETYLRADADDGGLLMEWVLITSQHYTAADGSTYTAVGEWTPPESPWHRTLGLLDYALTRLRKRINSRDNT